MENKKYRVCDYFNDDFKDKIAIENYKGVIYDKALDVIIQMFSSSNWVVNDEGDFCILFVPYEIDNNSINIQTKPMDMSYYLCSVIENILRNLGIDNINSRDSSYSIPNSDKIQSRHEFRVTLPVDKLKNILRKYYGILQDKEYNRKTLNGKYLYDNDLNKLANQIINHFFEMAGEEVNGIELYRTLEVINNSSNEYGIFSFGKQSVNLSKEDFNFLIKLIKNKLSFISSKDIMIQEKSDTEFSIICPSHDVYYDLKEIYDNQKLSHVLKK